MFWTRLIGVMLMPLLLTSCLLTPGRFTADLAIARDGSFTYQYRGEIILLTNQSFANEALGGMSDQPFNPETASCFKETGEVRDCTPAELAEQARQHEEYRRDSASANNAEREQLSEMLGGIDIGDPATMDAFAERLARQRGWRSVAHRGEGVFEVDYMIEGRLDRDFAFPVFPDFSFIIPMVTVTPRNDGTVMVQAPAFAQGEGSPFANTELGLPSSASRADGVFTVRTDGEVLTNNTENGPSREAADTVLSWTVAGLPRARPETLIRLDASANPPARSSP